MTDNTAAFNTTANLQLNGNGCNNTNNVRLKRVTASRAVAK